MKFKKELYSKISLLKAAYHYLDQAYIHLDADENYYYVSISSKDGTEIDENDFLNEMLAQSVRHEVYQQTKNVRELLLARALATSVVSDKTEEASTLDMEDDFNEDLLLKDWFLTDEESRN